MLCAGVEHQLHYYQNGVAVKAIRDIAVKEECMLYHSEASRDLWGWAVRYAVHVQNRIPQDALYGSSVRSQ